MFHDGPNGRAHQQAAAAKEGDLDGRLVERPTGRLRGGDSPEAS